HAPYGTARFVRRRRGTSDDDAAGRNRNRAKVAHTNRAEWAHSHGILLLSQKKKPAKRVARSAGFAICSPRGMGDPHDGAPRGSWHLSRVQRTARQAEGKARASRCGRRDRVPLSSPGPRTALALALTPLLRRHSDPDKPSRTRVATSPIQPGGSRHVRSPSTLA